MAVQALQLVTYLVRIVSTFPVRALHAGNLRLSEHSQDSYTPTNIVLC